MKRAIVGATVLDGRGGPPLAPATILIDGGAIAAVGSEEAAPLPPDAERLSLDGMFVLPGLIDAHVHFQGRRALSYREHVLAGEGLRAVRATADLARLLEAGFTTVRDCGSYTGLALKQALEEGSIPGPRLLAAGRFIERTGGADDPTFLPSSGQRAPAAPAGRGSPTVPTRSGGPCVSSSETARTSSRPARHIDTISA